MDEVDDDLAEPVRVAADRRERLGDLDPEGDALPIGEQSQALGRIGCDPTDVDDVDGAERPAALDPRQVEQLVDHLHEVAGLDLDLVDPVAHPGGHGIAGRLGLPGQRLGEQADGGQRRPELVREVVDELGPDLLEPAQLGDVLQDQPRPVGERRARTTSLDPSAPPSRPRPSPSRLRDRPGRSPRPPCR